MLQGSWGFSLWLWVGRGVTPAIGLWSISLLEPLSLLINSWRQGSVGVSASWRGRPQLPHIEQLSLPPVPETGLRMAGDVILASKTWGKIYWGATGKDFPLWLKGQKENMSLLRWVVLSYLVIKPETVASTFWLYKQAKWKDACWVTRPILEHALYFHSSSMRW